jgi:hypothetical protein
MCPGILGKNGPVWKNYHLDGLLRGYRGGQLLLTLPPPLEEHRESRPEPDTRFADIVGSHVPNGTSAHGVEFLSSSLMGVPLVPLADRNHQI